MADRHFKPNTAANRALAHTVTPIHMRKFFNWLVERLCEIKLSL